MIITGASLTCDKSAISASSEGLTRVPQFAVPAHGDDHQQVPQHVHHRGEDQHAGQGRYDPGGPGAALLRRGQTQLTLTRPGPVPQERERVRHHSPHPRPPTLTARPVYVPPVPPVPVRLRGNMERVWSLHKLRTIESAAYKADMSDEMFRGDHVWPRVKLHTLVARFLLAAAFRSSSMCRTHSDLQKANVTPPPPPAPPR